MRARTFYAGKVETYRTAIINHSQLILTVEIMNAVCQVGKSAVYSGIVIWFREKLALFIRKSKKISVLVGLPICSNIKLL